MGAHDVHPLQAPSGRPGEFPRCPSRSPRHCFPFTSSYELDETAAGGPSVGSIQGPSARRSASGFSGGCSRLDHSPQRDLPTFWWRSGRATKAAHNYRILQFRKQIGDWINRRVLVRSGRWAHFAGPYACRCNWCVIGFSVTVRQCRPYSVHQRIRPKRIHVATQRQVWSIRHVSPPSRRSLRLSLIACPADECLRVVHCC